MRQRFFITSTGTGIGKTFITAALARQARAVGKSAMVYKPVISGFDPAKAEESDTGFLLRSLDLPPTPDNIARMSPWRFTAPLAPSMAARAEQRELDFDEIVAQGKKAMTGTEDMVLIEGVGGVMVPLDEHHTVIDWIEALEIEAVLVVGSYLGTMSHTLTALDVLARRAIPVFAVIVDESEESTVPLQATVDELAQWTRLPVIVVKRRDPGGGEKSIPELRALLD